MAAVAITWLQLVVPWVITYLLVETVFVRSISGLAGDLRLTRAIGCLFLSWKGAGVIALKPPIAYWWETACVHALHTLQIVGWAALPVAWGFWWGTRFLRRGGPFLLAYSAYLLMPAALLAVVHYDILNIDLGDPLLFWPVINASGLGGVILAVVFFTLACRNWGRRTG